jgi:hypothetical protein
VKGERHRGGVGGWVGSGTGDKWNNSILPIQRDTEGNRLEQSSTIGELLSEIPRCFVKPSSAFFDVSVH